MAGKLRHRCASVGLLLLALLCCGCERGGGRPSAGNFGEFDHQFVSHEIDYEEAGCKLLQDFYSVILKNHLLFDREEEMAILYQRMWDNAGRIYRGKFGGDLARLVDRVEVRKLADCADVDPALARLREAGGEQKWERGDLFFKLLFPALFASLDPFSSFSFAVVKERQPELAAEGGRGLPFRVLSPFSWTVNAQRPNAWIVTLSAPGGELQEGDEISALRIRETPAEESDWVPVSEIPFSARKEEGELGSLRRLDGLTMEEVGVRLAGGREVFMKANSQYPYWSGYDERGGTLYLRLAQFETMTSLTLAALIEAHGLRRSPPGLIVLDLRFNGGGDLCQMADLAAAFLPPQEREVTHQLVDRNGETVSTPRPTGKARRSSCRDRTSSSPDAKNLPGLFERAFAVLDEAFVGVPLLILQNHFSASASEGLAGLLRERGRALLAGEESLGKPVAQYDLERIYPLEGSDSYLIFGFLLSSNHFFLPSGRPTAYPLPVDLPLPLPIEERDYSDYLAGETIGWDLLYDYERSAKLFRKQLQAFQTGDSGPPFWPEPHTRPTTSIAESPLKPYLEEYVRAAELSPFNEFIRDRCNPQRQDCQVLYLKHLAEEIE